MRTQKFLVLTSRGPWGRRRGGAVAALAGLLCVSAGAAPLTDTNGLDIQLRTIWNQYPGSTLAINGLPEASAPSQIAFTPGTPGEVRVDGEFLRIAEGPLGNFDFASGLPFKANSHRAWFSGDGGSSPLAMDFDRGFDISVDVRIDASPTAPRKEAGFFFNTGTGSDTQFILATNDGEIAAFGGPFPKASNLGGQGPPGFEWDGLTYTPGSTATLRMQYLPPTLDGTTGAVLNAATMQYWFNGVAAYDEPEPFGDTSLEFMPPNTELALKVQTQGTSFTNDLTTSTVVFSNLLITEPVVSIAGDYNNSGLVEQGDLDLVLLNWGTSGTPAGWVNEVPVGIVDQAELDGVLLNWGNTSEPGIAGGGSAVPEPTSLALLGLGGLALLRRRRAATACIAAVALGGVVAMPVSAQISDAAGFLVQRDTDDNDPGGTNTNLFPNSTLLVNGTPLVGTAGSVSVAGLGTTLTIDERNYDNDPATPGFGANRTNAWLADAGGGRVGLRNDQGFEIGVDLNLDAFFTQLVTGRNTRKEAGFRFKNPNDPAAVSQFLVTTDDDMGEVVAFGTSGIFIPLQVFDTIDPAGFYVPGDTARLTFKFTPPGVNVITDPAQYEFTYDPDAAGPASPITTGGVTPSNFAGLLTGTEMALVMQGAIADGNPDGDATTFANEFVTAVFSNLTLTFDALPATPGDYNNSGLVEQGDLDLVLLNWGTSGTPAGWVNEVPVGIVDQAELDGVLLNWGNTAEPAGTSVPEPASALLAAPLLALFARRSRTPRCA